VNTVIDEFEGTTVHRLAWNFLRGASYPRAVHLLAERYEKEGKIDYRLVVRYVAQGDKFLSIKRGESLIALVDGKRMRFRGPGSANNTDVEYHRGSPLEGIRRIVEMAVYSVDPETLKAIAAAQEVKIRIMGSLRNLEVYFEERNFDVFRQFVAEYVDILEQ